MGMEQYRYAVKRGRIWTKFAHIRSAWGYWTHTLGGVIMVLNDNRHWERLISPPQKFNKGRQV